MHKKLGKHRLYLHRPASTMLHFFRFQGNVNTKDFSEAIEIATHAHPFFQQKITIDAEGEAYFDEAEKVELAIEVQEYEAVEEGEEEEESLLDIAMEWGEEAVRYVFDIFHGEMLKHVLITDGQSFVWGIASHYLAGDARSIEYFARDVFRLMDSEDKYLAPVPSKLQEDGELPDEKSLFITAKLKVKAMNREWKRSAKRFTAEDRNRMTKNFHEAYPISIFYQDLSMEQVRRLQALAKEKNIRFVALIAAAYYKASGETDPVHFIVDTREASYEGVGIFQGGVQVQFPKLTSDIWEIAKKISTKLDEQLHVKNIVHHSASILSGLDNDLIDAAYYAAYDAFRNKSAASIQAMYGLKTQGTGLQISNMGMLYEDEKFSFANLVQVAMLPSFVPNFQRMIGVCTAGETLTITQAVYTEEDYEKVIGIRAKEQLEKLLEN